MAATTVAFGLLLIALGLGGYYGTKRISKTALIPAYFGVPILILGLLAQWDIMPRPAIIVALVISVLGFCGAARGLPQMVKLLRGSIVMRPIAAVMQSIMALLCLAYAVWAIRWLAS